MYVFLILSVKNNENTYFKTFELYQRMPKFSNLDYLLGRAEPKLTDIARNLPEKSSSETLQVIIVPFSHVDPGLPSWFTFIFFIGRFFYRLAANIR